MALRDEAGTAGSESRDGVSLAQGVVAAGEEDAEPVVGEVAVAAAGALDLLDEQVTPLAEIPQGCSSKFPTLLACEL